MKIKLAGIVGKKFGKEFEFHVKSPNEAIRALCQLVPGFRTYLTGAHERGVFFQIVTSNSAAGEGIGYEDLQLGCESFVLVPVITGELFGLFGGGKSGGFLGILAGIALVAFAMTGFGAVAAGSFMAAVQTATMTLGIGLIFTGVASLFAPGVPTGQKNFAEGRDADDAISQGASPVAANGQPVPLLYGEFIVSNMPIIASYINGNEGYFLGLISEGQIEGFPTSADDDLYLDGLIARESIINNVQVTDGTQTSKVIDVVKSAGFNIPVGVPFNPQGGDYDGADDGTPNTTVTRTFNNPDADEVLVRLSVGPVYQSRTRSNEDGSNSNFRDYTENDDSGGANNPTRIEIEVRDGNGDLIDDEDETFEKITATKLYEYSFDISGKVMPISITVTRRDRRGPRGPVTETGETSQRQYTWVKSPVTWVSADVTWAENLVYPYSSLLGIKFRAGEFARFPKVQVRMKGLIVPTLSSSLAVSYSWSDNPAYVLLDLLTNPRYGAGYRTFTVNGKSSTQSGIRISDIDLASFKRAARYCEDKQITFNGYINRDSDALELFRGIASTFQGQLIYAGGFITLVIDEELKGTDTVRIYSAANTISAAGEGEGGTHFAYEGTSRQARTTVVEVSYVEPSEFYLERKVVIESSELIDRYGWNMARVRALGCTDKEQAKRMGRYILASNTKSTETVTFKVGPDGAMLLPGDICLVLDPLKTGIESGGRIKSVSSSRLITDRQLNASTINANVSDYRLYVYGKSGVANKYSISSVSGDTINLSGGFGSNTPTTMDMWAVVRESASKQRRKEPMYRVQTIKEDTDNTFTVIAILYDKTKYPFVDGGGSAKLDSSYSKLFASGKNITIKPTSINFGLRNPTV